MKVLLIKDVYKLGRAGDIKKVDNGYGRNYLIPQGLAVLATPGAVGQSDRIRVSAEASRAIENKELSGLAEQISELKLVFGAKAGETGKLYGSVTTQMIAESIENELGVELDKRQIDTQPIRMLGVHTVNVRLTIDLIPEVIVLVHREGEAPETAYNFVEGEGDLDTDEFDFASVVVGEAEFPADGDTELAVDEEEEIVEDLEPEAEEAEAAE